MMDIQAGCRRPAGLPIIQEVTKQAWCDRCGDVAHRSVTTPGTEYSIKTYYCERHYKRECGEQKDAA